MQETVEIRKDDLEVLTVLALNLMLRDMPEVLPVEQINPWMMKNVNRFISNTPDFYSVAVRTLDVLDA